jgi:hypothetical protein
MEVLKENIGIHTDRRHSWNPWVEYNPDEDEFFVIWRTSGILRDDCSPDDDYECTKNFQSIDAARISPDGEILGTPIISPVEGPLDDISWKMMPRVAYNTFRKEYMVSFYMVTDVCLQCHDRNDETGEVTPASPTKCILCHPGGNQGQCNLVDFHDPAKGADCLSCHADCDGGSPPAPPTPHPDSCTECHEADAIHDRPGHTAFGNELYTMRIDSTGNALTPPERLFESPRSGGHPILTFNSVRKQYLIGTADYFHGAEADNVGFILDEDATILKGPIFFGEGSDGSWSHFLYYVAYNAIDDTYFIPWEDFRHATGAWYYGPNDIYASLLDGDGSTIRDITVIEDAAAGEHEQWYPCVAHNPDRNEFFAAWFDERPIVEDGGIVGRLFDSDGTPKGESFVVVDTKGSQGDVVIAYAPKHKMYFIVYQSTQNFVPSPDDPPWYNENDIYALWLDGETGLPVGDEIPIHLGDGDQTTPQVSYSPTSDRFLIIWWDTHAPEDYEPVPGETGQYGELSSVVMGLLGKGNVGGAIYGAPQTQLCAAEEIYGEDSKEVKLMRSVRDNILKSTSEGQQLIKLYYDLSPAIVQAMKKNENFKAQVKGMIDGVLTLFAEGGE